jgi:hypothetical protein
MQIIFDPKNIAGIRLQIIKSIAMAIDFRQRVYSKKEYILYASVYYYLIIAQGICEYTIRSKLNQ